MRISRPPGPTLRPFIKTLWAIDERTPTRGGRERVLPTGAMHVVFRISDRPLRVFEGPASPVGRSIGGAIVGGARSTFYVRDVSLPVHSVGAQLYPGAAPLLFGVPGDLLAERHTPLDELWGRAAGEARARIAEARSLEEQLVVFESVLASRLPRARTMHPAVAEALARFAHDADVGDAVKRSGYSHRRFIELFRGAVGLSPKTYARIVRFQRVIADVASASRVGWAQIAVDAGYSDQPHLNRDFLEFAGVSPRSYLEAASLRANHVPLARER